ncbi:MAG: hypothetical protein HYT16_01345 [DPANN group archaeon]|nr:hypothetical protein [DPANN group archaeon]
MFSNKKAQAGPAETAAAASLFGKAKGFMDKRKAAKEAMGRADAQDWDALKAEWKKLEEERKKGPTPQRRREIEKRQKEIEKELGNLEKRYTPKSEKVKGAVGKLFGGGGSGASGGGRGGGAGAGGGEGKPLIIRIIWLIVAALGGFLFFGGVGAIVFFGVAAALMALVISFRKHAKIAIPVFIIILLVILFFWSQTPMGRQMFGSLGTSSTIAATEGIRGVEGPINIVQQVVAGTYNPTDVWNSENVESQYVEQKDVGVKIDDVVPLRESFLPGQNLIIRGRVSAVGLLGKEAKAIISAETLESADEKVKSLFTNRLVSWACQIEGETSPGVILGDDIRDRKFSCSHAYADAATGGLNAGESRDVPVDVKVQSVGTELRAGKQYYYTDADTFVNAGDDKLAGIGISKDAVKSWQYGDDSVNLGLGLAGNEEIIVTDMTDVLGGRFENAYYLGASISNPATHSGDALIRIKDSSTREPRVKIFVPSPYPVTIYPDNDQEDFSCFDSDGNPKSPTKNEVETYNLPEQGIVKCTLKDSALGGRSVIRLEPVDSKTFYLKVKISNDKLTGPYGSFFMFAVLDYDYINKKIATVTVYNPKL